MTAKNIERLLEQTFLHDGAMQDGLYEYELEELCGRTHRIARRRSR